MIRVFAIASASNGSGAFDLGHRVSLWLSSRGARPLLLCGGVNHMRGIRKLSDASAYLETLDANALRGYLSAHGNSSCGILGVDISFDAACAESIARAYDIAVIVAGNSARQFFSECAHIPALVFAKTSEEGAFIKTGKLIAEMLGNGGPMRPVGFTMDGSDQELASRLADKWRIAFWGFSDGIGAVSERVLDRSAPIFQSAPVSRKSIQEKNAESADETSAVRAVLEELRKESEFKNSNLEMKGPDAENILRKKVAATARRIFASMENSGALGPDIEKLVKRVVEDSVGLGPLEPLINDETVTEIMVNGPQKIYVERNGVLELSNKHFADTGQLMAVIERMVASANRRIDELAPIADARLAGGHRLNAIIPPLAIDGPAVTIRKFSAKALCMDDAVESGMFSRAAADFLAACVRARVSIVISGGTGAGKTTLLLMLARTIGNRERIVTIEDAAELNIDLANIVRLEARPAGIEGTGAVSIRDLVRNALRMRPDRIIVGECRGPEALDMLQAMNTGHEGSLATVHANSPRDALARFETMVMMAGVELPLVAIREQVTRAVRLIIQVARLADGSRRVVEISEVTGMEGLTPCMQALAVFKPGDGLVSTGLAPRFAENLRAAGLELPRF